MIAYEDGIAALEWLAKAFGFRERARQVGPDGQLSHGEMEAGDGIIMLATPTPEYESPSHHRQTCEQARKWSAVPWIIDGVLVYVDDLDATSQTQRRREPRSYLKSKRIRLGAGIGPKTPRVIVGSLWSEAKNDLLPADRGCACSAIELLDNFYFKTNKSRRKGGIIHRVLYIILINL